MNFTETLLLSSSKYFKVPTSKPALTSNYCQVTSMGLLTV